MHLGAVANVEGGETTLACQGHAQSTQIHLLEARFDPTLIVDVGVCLDLDHKKKGIQVVPLASSHAHPI